MIYKLCDIKDVGFKTYDKLYNNCIVPILDYCSSVWGYTHFQSCENIQHRAIRYFLGVHRFAPIDAITGDVGWLPCQYRRWINIARYWNRLVSMNQNRLTKCLFNADYTLCRNNWCSDVKSVFAILNMSHCFDNKLEVDIRIIKHLITDFYTGQ
mgnify:CR=1 FL=1